MFARYNYPPSREARPRALSCTYVRRDKTRLLIRIELRKVSSPQTPHTKLIRPPRLDTRTPHDHVSYGTCLHGHVTLLVSAGARLPCEQEIPQKTLRALHPAGIEPHPRSAYIVVTSWRQEPTAPTIKKIPNISTSCLYYPAY